MRERQCEKGARPKANRTSGGGPIGKIPVSHLGGRWLEAQPVLTQDFLWVFFSAALQWFFAFMGNSERIGWLSEYDWAGSTAYVAV